MVSHSVAAMRGVAVERGAMYEWNCLFSREWRGVERCHGLKNDRTSLAGTQGSVPNGGTASGPTLTAPRTCAATLVSCHVFLRSILVVSRRVRVAPLLPCCRRVLVKTSK